MCAPRRILVCDFNNANFQMFSPIAIFSKIPFLEGISDAGIISSDALYQLASNSMDKDFSRHMLLSPTSGISEEVKSRKYARKQSIRNIKKILTKYNVNIIKTFKILK